MYFPLFTPKKVVRPQNALKIDISILNELHKQITKMIPLFCIVFRADFDSAISFFVSCKLKNFHFYKGVLKMT